MRNRIDWEHLNRFWCLFFHYEWVCILRNPIWKKLIQFFCEILHGCEMTPVSRFLCCTFVDNTIGLLPSVIIISIHIVFKTQNEIKTWHFMELELYISKWKIKGFCHCIIQYNIAAKNFIVQIWGLLKTKP